MCNPIRSMHPLRQTAWIILFILLSVPVVPETRAQSPVIETAVLEGVNDTWTAVTLSATFTAPVVVCSIHQLNNDLPQVVRLRNVVPGGFDIRLQNPSNETLVGETVYCMVAEEGAWTLPNGLAFEAFTVASTVTDRSGSWQGEEQTYAQSYTSPVVLGQVMTYNDPAWSVFWSRGPGQGDPPDNASLFTGKHVGQDSVQTRAEETIGYMVFESGSGQEYGNGYRAGSTDDAVVGFNAAPHDHVFGAPLSQVPGFALVTQMAMDGGDGSWASISGNGVTDTILPVNVDEDQIGDDERSHTTEQVAYLVFDASWILQDGMAQSDQQTAPAIAPIADQQNEPGDEVSIQVDAADLNGDPLTYAAAQLPGGITIDPATGLISGTISGNGLFTTVITVSDGTLESQVTLRWIVREDNPSSDIAACAPLNFNDQFVRSYDAADQDRGEFTILDDGVTFSVVNNGWKAIEFNYTIRPETMLEFDFRSDLQGQRHGIGFDDDLDVTRDRSFILYGTAGPQGANTDFDTYQDEGNYQRVLIPVGEYLAGQSFSFMYFYAERDNGSGEASSFFRNLQIYDDINRNAICDNIAPVLTALPDLQNTSDKQVSIAVLASDHEGDPLTYSASGLPSGITINEDTGVIQGTIAESGTFEVTVQVNDGLDSDTITFTWEVLDANNLPVILAGFQVAGVSSDWTPVTLDREFQSPVIVCSPYQRANPEPFVIRMQNVQSTGFDVRIQNPSDVPLQGETLYCLVGEEGGWVLPDGSLFEARTTVSTVTDDNDSWVGEEQNYLQTYNQPAVIGQVMSSNDARWSTFWSRGSSQGNLPDAVNLYVGKHVGQDPDSLRSNETLGYMVFERGGGTMDGTAFEIGITADEVVGISDDPYAHTFNAPFSKVPEIVVVGLSAMDGGDGGWAVLDEADRTANAILLEIQEDQEFDDERGHTTEQVVYVAFEDAFTIEDGAFNQAPIISRFVGRTDGINDPIFLQIDADDPEGESLFFTAEGLPPGISLDPVLGFFFGTLTQQGIFTVTITVSDGLFASEMTFPWQVVPALQANALESRVLTDITSEWVSVDFTSVFLDPIVVCNALSDVDAVPKVVRINRLSGDGFDLRVQSPSGQTVQPTSVHCLSAESGTWNLPDGSRFQASRVLSESTDASGRWSGTREPFLLPFESPVVLGQVMSSIDQDWSVFWSAGATIDASADQSALRIGKHAGEDSDSTRSDELLGYMVFEAGTGAINGTTYEAGVANKVAKGYDDAIDALYAFNATFSESPSVILASQSGITDTDGSWAIVREDFISAAGFLVQTDEDQLADRERSHVAETVFYTAFSAPFVWALEAVDPQPGDTTATSISDGIVDLPREMELAAPYPNPFIGNTVFTVGLPETGSVEMAVFDIQGRRVETLWQGNMPAGYHRISWNGQAQNGAEVGSGVYFIRMTHNGRAVTRKVVRIR